MPRTPLFSPDKIYGVRQDFSFMENGHYKEYNDPIWYAATEKLPGMSLEYIWLYITKNRNNVSQRIHGFIETKQQKKRKIDVSNWSMREGVSDLQVLTNVIHLSTEEWKKLNLNTKKYADNREYEGFEIGWTDKIYYSIWNHLKLPCCFAFETPKININSEIFLTIRGSCHECRNRNNLYSYSDVTDAGIDFHVSTHDSRHIIHKKKRQLREPNRVKVAKEVEATSAFKWRIDKANELMNFGDKEQSNLYSNHVLRNVKYKQKYKDLGLDPSDSPLISVLKLKADPTYSQSIREIGADKFYIMYWTPEQIYLYNLFIKNDAIGSISMDATSKVMKAPPNLNNSKRYIFLYQIITIDRGKSLPIAQLISEKHDANTLTYWIREWLRCGAQKPKQIVSDFSLALLNASSLAFNNMPLKQYIDEYFDQLCNKPIITNKDTILRIDVAHLIKFVTRWPFFKSKEYYQKDFYVRCIGILLYSTTFNDFCRILKMVLAVAFGEYLDETSESLCYTYQQHLLEIMKTGFEVDTFPSDHLFEDVSSMNDFQLKKHETKKKTVSSKNKRPIEIFLDEMKTKCILKENKSIKNKYYNVEFGKRLLSLCKYFILWTAVIPVQYYTGKIKNIDLILKASSSANEEYFKDLKQYVCNNQLNQRVDCFMKIHLDSLRGTAKLIAAASSSSNKSKSPSKKNTDESNIDSSTSFIYDASQLCITHIDNENSDNELNNNKIDEETEPKFSSTLIDTEKLNITNENKYKKYSIENISDEINYIFNENKANDTNTKCWVSDETINDKTNILKPLNTNSKIILNSNNSHLNYVDEWGGLLKNDHRKGHYLIPQPDIENLHRVKKSKGKLPLIINGNALSPINTTKGMIKVINTCPFDSIAHCIRGAYNDWDHYHKYIEQSNSKFFEMLKLFVRKQVSDSYKLRAEIISEFKKLDFQYHIPTLDCLSNISNVIDCVLCDEPSILIKNTCHCKKVEKDDLAIIAPDLGPIYEGGIVNIDQAIAEYIKSYKRSCNKCKIRMKSDIKFSHHLFIDIESIHWNVAAVRMGYANKNYQFSLNDIPDQLDICDNKFQLIGAVEHIKLGSIGHYRSFIKIKATYWELHDGITKESQSKKVTCNELKLERCIHILFYIKKEPWKGKS